MPRCKKERTGLARSHESTPAQDDDHDNQDDHDDYDDHDDHEDHDYHNDHDLNS